MENVKRMLEELKKYCEEHGYCCEAVVTKNDDSNPLYLITGGTYTVVPLITMLLKQACKLTETSYISAAHYVYLSCLAEEKGGDKK